MVAPGAGLNDVIGAIDIAVGAVRTGGEEHEERGLSHTDFVVQGDDDKEGEAR